MWQSIVKMIMKSWLSEMGKRLTQRETFCYTGIPFYLKLRGCQKDKQFRLECPTSEFIVQLVDFR